MTTNAPGQQLQRVRDALLPLHKTLVDSERVSYEQAIGPIPSSTHFLKLLTSDPWFAWLHPLSLLIVAMDEAVEEKDGELTAEAAEALVQRTRKLLVASEEGDGFPRSYFEALQRDPDVVFAHARVAELLRPRTRPT